MEQEREHLIDNNRNNIVALRFLNNKKLVTLKNRALRSGTWFKTLKRIDRVLFDLTIRVVETIHSSLLSKSIALIITKLESGMGNSFQNSIRDIGLPLAQKISAVAQKLGNIYAKQWAQDTSFVLFLTVMHINNAPRPKR
jgi:hypothetical protein